MVGLRRKRGRPLEQIPERRSHGGGRWRQRELRQLRSETKAFRRNRTSGWSPIAFPCTWNYSIHRSIPETMVRKREKEVKRTNQAVKSLRNCAAAPARKAAMRGWFGVMRDDDDDHDVVVLASAIVTTSSIGSHWNARLDYSL